MQKIRSTQRHLKLVTKDYRPPFEGPITRLGLAYRFQTVPRWQFLLMLSTKLMVLATLLYVVFKH